MSLINEALKKARHEAARREAMDKGQPYPVTPRHLPPRRRGARLPWILAGVLAVAVVIAAAAWLQGEHATGSGAAARPSDEAARGDGLPRIERTVVEPAAEAVPQPGGGVPPSDASGKDVEGALHPVPADSTEASPAVASPTAAEGQGAVEREVPPAPRDGPETYRGTAHLPDGRTLSLAGVATGDQPVAVINGRVLGLGEGVEGFILQAVDSGRAVLREGDRIIVLELP